MRLVFIVLLGACFASCTSSVDTVCAHGKECAVKAGTMYSETECRNSFTTAREKAESVGCGGAFDANASCVAGLPCSPSADLVMAECGGKALALAKCLSAGIEGGFDSGTADGSGDETEPTDPVWGCLGNVKAPLPKKMTVSVAVPVVDALTKTAATLVSGKVCNKADVSCSTPIASLGMPSPQGVFQLTLPAAFDGYLDVNGGGKYLEAIVFFNPSLSDDVTHVTIPLFTPTALGAIASQVGTQTDASLGVGFFFTQNCQLKDASGVSIASDTTAISSRTFYYSNGLVSNNSTQTDVSGYAGIFNLPIGTRSVTATLVGSGQMIGTVMGLVRANAITYSLLPPMP